MGITSVFIIGTTSGDYVPALTAVRRRELAGAGYKTQFQLVEDQRFLTWVKMREDPLEAVNTFIERAYVRLQVGEVLLYCLERKDAAPMRTLVEELVFAGPRGLGTLREVQAEVRVRRSQLEDDLHQVFSDLVEKFQSYEFDLAKLHTPQSFARLNAVSLVTLLLESPIVEEADRKDCLQALHNTQDMVASLIQHLRLLNEIETHLDDWLWGLIYQSTQQEWSGQLGSTIQKTQML